MPPSPRPPSPRALGVLVGVVAVLAACVLPALPATAGTGAATSSSGSVAAGGASAQASDWRVTPVGPVLTNRYRGPAPARPLPTAPRVDRRSYARTSGTDAAGTTAGTQAVRTAGAPVRSTWKVTYDAGFQADPLARSEFQRAVDTWASYVGSAVPITVDARFRVLDPRVLGSAGPGDFVEQVRDGRYAPGEMLYPVALANAKAGRDLVPPTAVDPGFDILATFPSGNPGIHYGPGPVPADQYDFYSTALHELAHGLGFTSFFDDRSGVGHYGESTATPYLLDFDKLVTAGSSGTNDLVQLPNDSTQLGSALTSRNVYWRGAAGTAADGGRRPKLFAPSPFEDGSSIAHLDEATYPPGTADALMTPAGAPGELNADVGDVALGILGDLGWSVPVKTPAGSPVPSAAPTTTAPAAPPTPSSSPAPSSVPAPTSPGSRFTAVTPRRLLDTRTGLGLAGPLRVGPGGSVDLVVAGDRTGVPAGATAVVLNVTAVGATRATDVRVYPTPTDGAVPTVSNLNLGAQQTRAAVVTVPVGADGSVRLRNAGGTVSLLADLAGYYAPGAQTAFHPVAPVRLLDTRTRTVTALGPGDTLDLAVAGTAGVPASASAVVLTVTGVAATAATDLAVYPATSSTAPPTTSNVNLGPGAPVPNLAVVKVGDGGTVRLRNSAGRTSVLVDLSGWYDATAPGGQLFHPVSPVRMFDTRTDPEPSRRRLGPGAVAVFRTTSGPAPVPARATAVLLNVTGVGASGGTDVRVYPHDADGSVPVVSNLNLGTGQTHADAVVVRTGPDGAVVFRNQSSSVALVSDLAGWFGP